MDRGPHTVCVGGVGLPRFGVPLAPPVRWRSLRGRHLRRATVVIVHRITSFARRYHGRRVPPRPASGPPRPNPRPPRSRGTSSPSLAMRRRMSIGPTAQPGTEPADSGACRRRRSSRVSQPRRARRLASLRSARGRHAPFPLQTGRASARSRRSTGQSPNRRVEWVSGFSRQAWCGVRRGAAADTRGDRRRGPRRADCETHGRQEGGARLCGHRRRRARGAAPWPSTALDRPAVARVRGAPASRGGAVER